MVRSRLLALMLMSLAATLIVPVSGASAQELVPPTLPTCPLEDGTILDGDGTDWGPDFLRSDKGRGEAVFGPVPVDLVAGDYDVVLVSFDDHSNPAVVQLLEQWYIDVTNAGDAVYTTPAISDLPEDEELLVEEVATHVRIDTADAVTIRHAAYPDKTDPNSVFALCAAFVRVGFIDDDNSIFESDIEWMFRNGYTKGCNPPDNNRFCPENNVTRGQMAAFLTRALGLTEAADDPFTDDDDSIFEGDIERLAAAGITRGCNPPVNDEFCPNDFVTRGQMAAFLTRALGLTEAADDPFTDDDDSIFEGDIERLAAAGITRGCNPPANDEFCPDKFVTRGQMAAFLRRALS